MKLRRAPKAESAEPALQALSRSTVARVAITGRIVREARDLRLRFNLKSMDALHLACAAAGQADAFLTDDDALIALGRHRGMPIIRPERPGDVALDFPTEDGTPPQP